MSGGLEEPADPGSNSTERPPQIHLEDETGEESLAGLDFGAVEVGGAQSAAFWIRNSGDRFLPLYDLRLRPEPGSDEFTVGEWPLIVLAGERSPITISFAPQEEGGRSAILEIESGDPDEDIVSLDLVGEGLAP